MDCSLRFALFNDVLFGYTLTVVLQEPGDRAQSLGVISVEAEESETQTICETDAVRAVPFSTDEEPVPLDREASSQVETDTQLQQSSSPGPEEPTGSRDVPTSATGVTPNAISSTVESEVPMPVTADANVVDPISYPDTTISSTLDVQPQAQRQALVDDLFTPTAVTPAELPENIHSQVPDELSHAFFGPPTVSSTSVEEVRPALNFNLLLNIDLVINQTVEQNGESQPMQLPPIGAEATNIRGVQTAGNIHTTTSRDGLISMPTSPLSRDPPVSMHVTLTQKPTDPILVSDPYPYSLSTPGVSLTDPTEEDTEQDNSMSSNSTLEKDLEDKETSSILDDVDELELQYPSELELNIGVAAKSKEISKIVDEVVDADADGDFDPEFAATNEIRLVADLPTSDSATAPGPINGVEKDGVGQKDILSM